jgi:hypothetical protein
MSHTIPHIPICEPHDIYIYILHLGFSQLWLRRILLGLQTLTDVSGAYHISFLCVSIIVVVFPACLILVPCFESDWRFTAMIRDFFPTELFRVGSDVTQQLIETTWRVFYRSVPKVCGGQQRSFAGNRKLEEGVIDGLHLSSKFQGNSTVARRRITRLSVWCYMCCGTLILGVCNLVRLL